MVAVGRTSIEWMERATCPTDLAVALSSCFLIPLAAGGRGRAVCKRAPLRPTYLPSPYLPSAPAYGRATPRSTDTAFAFLVRAKCTELAQHRYKRKQNKTPKKRMFTATSDATRRHDEGAAIISIGQNRNKVVVPRRDQ